MKNNSFEPEVGAFDDAPPCKYNLMVGCRDKSVCDVCGWNPAVSKERMEKTYGEKFVSVLSDQE